MAKDINQFMKEVSDYINKFIAGKGDTCITGCRIPGTVLNRGHVIAVDIKLPKEYLGTRKSIYQSFYAEELMKEHSGRSIAAIGEIINAVTNDGYPGLLEMLKLQESAMEKTLDDCSPNDLIAAALPTRHVDIPGVEHFITKEMPELELTLMMKAFMCDSPFNKNQSYFGPVGNNGRTPSDQDWEIAKANSRINAKLSCGFIPIKMFNIEGFNPHTPFGGTIIDTAGFYDYFYLVDSLIWKQLITDLGKQDIIMDEVIIIPEDAYTAKFILVNDDVRFDSSLHRLAETGVQAAIEDSENLLPIFRLECETMKFMKHPRNKESIL